MISSLPKRTVTRIMVIQSMYSYELLKEQISIQDALKKDVSGEDYDRCDNVLFETLTDAMKNSNFDNVITRHISKGWNLNRIDIVVLLIIRVAVCEFVYFPNTDRQVIVSEYTNITSYFADIKEVDFVNAILDRIGSGISRKIKEEKSS